ncbi:MAG: phosphoenolpyruvate carboxykinase [Thiothrix sp.]|nr:phosphoenolpyruvate carboxykinase [Thiothrix sp.]
MVNRDFGADKFGFKDLKAVHWNLLPAALYEHAVRNGEAELTSGGAIVAETGVHTGRSPKDKFTVRDATTENTVWWGGNQAITPEQFENLYQDFIAHAKGKEIYAQDLYGGADPAFRIKTRVYTELAWHSQFIRTLLIRPELSELASFVPELTIVDLPSFKADPKRHGARTETMVAIDFARKIVLIGGTYYAGEIKKSIFSVLNYLLPRRGIMSMHASANVGKNGDVAILFGLSGTGKTTLSADPERKLVGDDEHGWGDQGVFNLEGGCYAKVINLSPKQEPMIYATTKTFGTVLENVVMNEQTRELDLFDGSVTENTRACYPVSQIPNALFPGKAGHPQHIIMLTCDAFGVLPPVSKLTPAQAMYHFISGYTAKVAGTEKGVTEPTTTFSTCFGAPFMALHPSVYADLLGKKISEHGVSCWLLNTGWSGGPYGVGERMKISHTRSMLNAALRGDLKTVETRLDPIFGLHVPVSCPEVPAEILDPANTWTDRAAYQQKAEQLAQAFHANFARYADGVSPEIREAGPLAGR